ncbi:MAG: ribonuclease D [Anaerolineae bacterium]
MNDMPTLPPPVWVDRPETLQRMIEHLLGQPVLAVDTESNSLYAYREQVCLIQISVPETDYLVDTLVLSDLSELGPLLADPSVIKVFHGAEYDLSVLHRDFQFVVDNLFDTMWASRVLGWPAHGLADLLQTCFGVHLDKKYQRANWGMRPLPPEQLNYARLDTHYLLPLYELQVQELEARKRWPQAQHCFARVVRSRWEFRGFDPEGFWRLPGVRDLDDAGRGVLRELYLLRDRIARQEDRPAFKICSNKILMMLSAQRPQSLTDLKRAQGLARYLAKRYGRELIIAIRRGREQPIPWQERPRSNHEPALGPNGHPSAACQARFEALRAWRNATAHARGVEPDMVATNQTLWMIAHQGPRTRAELLQGGLLADWQLDEFGDQLLAVLNGER